MATPTVADIRSHVAALREAVKRHRADPRFPREWLDALEQRAAEVDAQALRLASGRRGSE